ncbi:hypothetical protein ABID22_003065 [Pontibacter aydingkolensis]|uniref:SpoIIAA-like n=1 Tax=Pontibacter aydingkolensis TaxID=1911536 RepID=A0ABS7CXT1_9BACT|nr:hypothetical protein [Pontibacter aydingkolensis]MBW7468678.1 hypothetical protein [Pontibacter aydingkolensis]
MRKLELKVAWKKDFATMRYSPGKKLIWTEWRGAISSEQLREAIIYECEFILANRVELMLSDYTMMIPPALEDQVWVANHTTELLQHSSLRLVANLMAQDIFQQITIHTIYAFTSDVLLPCESRDFVTKEEALEWLFLGDNSSNKQADNSSTSHIKP